MKVAVLLSGCGVYDGSEIHESVLTLLCLSQKKIPYFCVAPDKDQHHVINHLTGQEEKETRNVFVESSRISRGKISSLSSIDPSSISSLIIPGGFGAAKNLSSWAAKGRDMSVLPEVESLILHCVKNKKPIVCLCVSPIIVSKVLQKTGESPVLTVGNIHEKSEYNIKEINGDLSSFGSNPKNVVLNGFCYDEKLKVISSPCYMMESEIEDVYKGIRRSIDKLSELL